MAKIAAVVTSCAGRAEHLPNMIELPGRQLQQAALPMAWQSLTTDMSSRVSDDETGKNGVVQHRLGLLTTNMSTDVFEGSKALQRLLPAASQPSQKHVLAQVLHIAAHVICLVAHHLSAAGHGESEACPCSSTVHHCTCHMPSCTSFGSYWARRPTQHQGLLMSGSWASQACPQGQMPAGTIPS